jgi:hypothetical protein
MAMVKLSPDEAFDRDVPKVIQDDVLTMICEALHDERHGHSAVTILERDHLDAINVRGSGYVEIGDVEYSFIAESGNNMGFVLEDWDGDKQFKPHQPTKWVLAPLQHLVGDAVMAGRGDFLLAKWDALASRPDVAKIPNDYAYDKHFQPGGKIEGHYRDKAAKLGFQIVSDDYAAEIRKQLAGA